MLTRSTLGLLHITFCTFVPVLWLLIYDKISLLFNILKTKNEQNFTKFYICIHIDKIYVGIVTTHFSHICTKVMALDLLKISFLLIILRTNWQNFTKFYICIHITKIYVGIVTHHFSHISTRVMALDLCQNFVSLQYLENKWTEFHQILYIQSYWQDLCWDCYATFFVHLYQSYGNWFTPKFRFRSISQEQIDRFPPNCIYAYILTRSSLWL